LVVRVSEYEAPFYRTDMSTYPKLVNGYNDDERAAAFRQAQARAYEDAVKADQYGGSYVIRARMWAEVASALRRDNVW
jgi:hypothetical protein